MSNDINDLRSTLFETLNAVKDGTLDLDRAKLINETAQTIINTAKAEVDYMRVSGANITTDFIPQQAARPTLPPPPNGSTTTATGTKTVQPIPGGSVTTHKLR